MEKILNPPKLQKHESILGKRKFTGEISVNDKHKQCVECGQFKDINIEFGKRQEPICKKCYNKHAKQRNNTPKGKLAQMLIGAEKSDKTRNENNPTLALAEKVLF